MRNKLAQIKLFGLNWRSFVALISKLRYIEKPVSENNMA
jgi:hypothetical protein